MTVAFMEDRPEFTLCLSCLVEQPKKYPGTYPISMYTGLWMYQVERSGFLLHRMSGHGCNTLQAHSHQLLEPSLTAMNPHLKGAVVSPAKAKT